MQIANKLIMFSLAVRDMPKAREFYESTLGLKVVQDYRQDDDNWWVSLDLPEGGVTVTLSTHLGNMKPGAMVLYLATSDITAAHKALSDEGVKISEIQADLFGPGSDAGFFTLEDPDGNLIHITQAKSTPFAAR